MTTNCIHDWKMRLLGFDARLWECAGAACRELFVEGRSWKGEPSWLPVGAASRFDICCGHCLDGFCTSVDDKPCDRCGRGSARVGVSR